MRKVIVSFSKKILDGFFQLPSSKSISSRLLIIRYLSGGLVQPADLSDAADVVRLDNALREIGCNPATGSSVEKLLDAGDSGTAMRFLTALLAVTPGRYCLTGTPGLIRRPVGALVEALRHLGAHIDYTEREGYPPLRFGEEKASGGTVSIESGTSSQYLSAFLLIAPVLKHGLSLRIAGTPVSWPYVEMTLSLLKRSGITVTLTENEYVIRPQSFTAASIPVEPDWSSAAFWYEMAALSPQADLVLCGLKPDSIQGDRIAASLFRCLGVETRPDPKGIRLVKMSRPASPGTIHMAGCPDLVLPFATACAMLAVSAEITGVGHLQLKESPRLTSFCHEMEKTGAGVSFSEDGILHVAGNQPAYHPGVAVDAWNDHRIAMSLAPLAIPCGTVTIRNPRVTAKSYPGFWDELRKAGFDLQS